METKAVGLCGGSARGTHSRFGENGRMDIPLKDARWISPSMLAVVAGSGQGKSPVARTSSKVDKVLRIERRVPVFGGLQRAG